MDKNQKSYIKVICDEEADPRYNKLQLRTEPPTYIELQPGENILTVEEYPALKYGFSQIDDYGYEENPDLAEESPYEYNGGGILEVDLSHFDASEVTSLDNMFLYFVSLRKIEFGFTEFKNIQTACSAFDRIGDSMDVLDLTAIDFSTVIDTSFMLYGASAPTIDLYGADFSSVEKANEMFTNIETKTLIFDSARGIAELADIIPFQDGFIEKISLKGCKRDVIEAFAMAIYESGRNVEIDLGKSWGYKIENGEFKLLKKVTNPNSLTSWLAANPSKTKRDWLIEVRCATDVQREAMNELLELCDNNEIPYEIGLDINLRNEYKEYLEKNVCESTHIDFQKLNTEKRSHDGSAFIKNKKIDLYFPSVRWYINVGEEIDDAVNVDNLVSPTWLDGAASTLASDYSGNELVTGFHVFLKEKYNTPSIKNKGQISVLLPWNHEIAESESIKNYRSLPFKIGAVESFMKQLFKDDYDTPCGVKTQLKSMRRDKFLTSYPEIKEKRENMLHTLVIGMQQEEGITESLNVSVIETLLETVDNELYVLYPEYNKAIKHI